MSKNCFLKYEKNKVIDPDYNKCNIGPYLDQHHETSLDVYNLDLILVVFLLLEETVVHTRFPFSSTLLFWLGCLALHLALFILEYICSCI